MGWPNRHLIKIHSREAENAEVGSVVRRSPSTELFGDGTVTPLTRKGSKEQEGREEPKTGESEELKAGGREGIS